MFYKTLNLQNKNVYDKLATFRQAEDLMQCMKTFEMKKMN